MTRRKPSPTTDKAGTQARGRAAYRLRLRGIFFLLLGALVTLLMLSPSADRLDDESLAFHMTVEHTGFALGSFLTLYGSEKLIVSLYASSLKTQPRKIVATFYLQTAKANHSFNRRGIIGLSTVSVLLAYWHIPENFDGASLNPGLHIVMHLSFAAVGGLIFLNLKVVSRAEIMAHTLLLMHVMLIGGILLIVTSEHLYAAYPFAQQAEAGLFMALPHPFVTVGLVLYLFNRYFWSR